MSTDPTTSVLVIASGSVLVMLIAALKKGILRCSVCKSSCEQAESTVQRSLQSVESSQPSLRNIVSEIVMDILKSPSNVQTISPSTSAIPPQPILVGSSPQQPTPSNPQSALDAVV